MTQCRRMQSARQRVRTEEEKDGTLQYCHHWRRPCRTCRSSGGKEGRRGQHPDSRARPGAGRHSQPVHPQRLRPPHLQGGADGPRVCGPLYHRGEGPWHRVPPEHHGPLDQQRPDRHGYEPNGRHVSGEGAGRHPGHGLQGAPEGRPEHPGLPPRRHLHRGHGAAPRQHRGLYAGERSRDPGLRRHRPHHGAPHDARGGKGQGRRGADALLRRPEAKHRPVPG